MFLSKIWFVLVGLMAGVATTAAFVAPKSADRKLVAMEGQRLDRAQYAADQMMRSDAHRWIDYAAKLGRDANLIEALDAASKGSGEARMLNDTVRGRLKVLVPDLANVGIEYVGAVDARGRVVARAGDQEGVFGDAIGGAEVIGDALRGYLSDDVWGTGGRVVRVVAVPVLSKTKDRVVGALFVAAETGKRMCELLKKNLGVDVAVLLKGQILASTITEALLGDLAAQVEQRAAEIAEHKRTRPIPMKAGSDRLFAVGAPFIGQASAQGAAYVLIGTVAPAGDPLAMLMATTADDLKWDSFPWIPLGAGLLAILGVGIWLQRVETEGPISRLRAEMQQLAKGDIQKINDSVYSGKLGGIARDVNASMERFTHAPSAKTEVGRKDINAIMGKGAEGSVFDLPASSPFGGAGSPFGSGNTPAPMAMSNSAPSSPLSLSPSGFMGSAPAAPSQAGSSGPLGFGAGSAFGVGPLGGPSPAASPFAAPPLNAPAPPPPPFGGSPFGGGGASPFAATQAPPGPFSSPFGGPAPISSPISPPIPPPLAMPAAPPPAVPAKALGATPGRRLTSPQLPGPPPVAADPPIPYLRPSALELDTAVPSSLILSPFTTAGLPGAQPDPYATDQETTPTSELNEDPKTRTLDPEEAHFRDVYAEYVATRERCGESIQNLSIDKFVLKLQDNKAQLVAKYACQTARFSVYVKDGRAAIKATPVR